MATYLLNYLKLGPSKEEIATIQLDALMLARPHGVEMWDVVVTSPEARLMVTLQNNPTRSLLDSRIEAIAYKSKAIECLFYQYENVKPTKDICARGETRIREDNIWLVEKVISGKLDQWSFTILPRGRRFIVALSVGQVTFFDRDTFTPILPPPFYKIPAGAWTALIIDCVVGPDGVIHVFDVICSNGNPVCHLPLSERIAALPKGFSVCKYRNASKTHSKAVKITRDSGKRIVLVDSTAHYRPNLHSAVIWRPPRNKDVAVLCLRTGMAMAVAFKDDVLLAPVGKISKDTLKYDHMGCYACQYVPDQDAWKIIEPVKRKEPLSMYWQAMGIIEGTRVVPDSCEIFPSSSSNINSVKK